MKRIWLTGASSGIGAALAEILLNQGHLLAVSARNAQALETLHAAFPQQVLALPGDLTDPLQVRAIGEQIGQVWGYLDQVILNAGTCEYLDAGHFEANMIERVMRANVFSAAYCVEAALPLLRKVNRPWESSQKPCAISAGDRLAIRLAETIFPLLISLRMAASSMPLKRSNPIAGCFSVTLRMRGSDAMRFISFSSSSV